MSTVISILVLAALTGLAFYNMSKKKKNGGCDSGGCGGCCGCSESLKASQIEKALK